MISIDDIEIFLPKYLSPEAEQALFEDLKQFRGNVDRRIYTSHLKGSATIFQGDGIEGLLYVNLPEPKIDKVPAMVLSNTCDINPKNDRISSLNILYAPIFNMKKYEAALIDSKVDANRVYDHIDSIRKEKITSVFYLPVGGALKEESLVFFDRINNCSTDFLRGKNIEETRIFTLSDFGLYLFLFKLSIHFTRINEGVERGTDTVPQRSDH